MQLAAKHFKTSSSKALLDAQLQKALGNVEKGFIDKRQKAADALPEFDALRDNARDIKNHVLAHLDLYLEEYERNVTASGGHVHWAETAEDARRIVLDICQKAGARTVTKGKSMITEEIALNDHLSANGIEPVETDLGEYIIQLRGEYPSHIIAPAVHLNKDQVEGDFRRVHTHLPEDRDLSDPVALLGEARDVLRQRYFAADVGITGANFLIAETGTSVIVTNEGNGDLTQTLGKIHVVVASIEKIVPTLEDTSQILRVLARSATGQDMSVYTTFFHRAEARRRPGRAGSISCGAPGQRPVGDARHRVPGHAALHPLRRLHEPLPGLSRGRRPCVWLGLSRPDGCGADAVIERHRGDRTIAQCVDLLRPLRGGVPDADSAAQDDAALARAGVRAQSDAFDRTLRPQVLGLFRQAAEALSPCRLVRHALAVAVQWIVPALSQPALRRRLDAPSRLPRA